MRSLVAILALFLSACGPLAGYLGPGFAKGDAPPRRVLIVPPEVEFHELSAGGVPEKVHRWQAEARVAVADALHAAMRRQGVGETLDLPVLDDTERAGFAAHQALFRRVAEQIQATKDENDATWKALEPRLEFTIGPGLATLATRTGADSILFVDGVDVVSSGPRRVALILTTLLFGLPVLGPGSSYLQMGLVDLASGRVLWFGRDYTIGSNDLRDPGVARDRVAAILASWPATGRMAGR